jgi:hypothetical protein
MANYSILSILYYDSATMNSYNFYYSLIIETLTLTQLLYVQLIIHPQLLNRSASPAGDQRRPWKPPFPQLPEENH